MSVSPKRTESVSHADALDTVHRDLTGIYASIAEALRDDPEIMPWTLRELRGVLDYIQAVRKGGAPARS